MGSIKTDPLRQLVRYAGLGTLTDNILLMIRFSAGMIMSYERNVIYGLILVGFGSLFFLGFVYAAIVSKLLPPSDNVVISAIQNDW